jgi:hypothetical protein
MVSDLIIILPFKCNTAELGKVVLLSGGAAEPNEAKKKYKVLFRNSRVMGRGSLPD